MRASAAPRRSRPNSTCWLLLVACFAVSEVTFVLAGDWPQILGPTRDGQASGEKLLAAWPTGSPQVLWTHDVGSGFAGVAVRDRRAIVFHRRGAELIAEALAVETGQAVWQVRLPTKYVSSISEDNGPRCVPLIHGPRVFLMGPGGELAGVDFETGKLIWQRNILVDFKAPEGYFGCGSCPIVEDNKLLLNVGGAGGAGIVALDPADGTTLWKATDEGASYSSPVAVTLGDARHLIFVTRLNVVSLDPQSGRVRFRFPFGARGPTVNGASPLILGDHLFTSASYGVGACWAKLGGDSATTEWANDDVMSSQYSTCVESGGLLFGIDGRQDVGVARLRAFDPNTGAVHWTQEGFGTGSLMLADGKLVILKTDGTLLVVEPTARGYRPLATARLFNTTVQALPALSNGLLFARDTRQLKCFVIGVRPER